jgi:hypothetical protein
LNLKPRLFSYTVAQDYGSAPNPFWGVCTLTICKPVIRRKAEKEDWVVGLRKNSVVYAMRITGKKTLAEYDEYCQVNFPKKIPLWSSKDFRRQVGDCIYDYSIPASSKLRQSIHVEGNVKTDLGGIYALLSEDFYYFGNCPRLLPAHLQPIIHKRGHKSNANDKYFDDFIKWIRIHRETHNTSSADPELRSELTDSTCARSKCSKRDHRESETDEALAKNCG